MKWKKALILIIFLFIIWISWAIYAYFSGFDLKIFFENSSYGIYTKIWIMSLLYIFRNYLFIPSTLLILLTWFILQDFVITLIISTIWVWIGILQTYFVWVTLADEIKKNKHYEVIKSYQEKIKKNWFKVIFFASLVPIIPVDLVYYAAATTKYDIRKFFLAGLLWEFPLIVLYSWLWKEAEKYIFQIIWVFVILWILYFWYLFWKKKKEEKK